MKKREVIFIVTALILGAVFGGLIGDVIGKFLPEGAAKTLFSDSIQIGLDTIRIELYAISLTFGLMFKINFLSVLTVIFIIVYFRWWYL